MTDAFSINKETRGTEGTFARRRGVALKTLIQWLAGLAGRAFRSGREIVVAAVATGRTVFIGVTANISSTGGTVQDRPVVTRKALVRLVGGAGVASQVALEDTTSGTVSLVPVFAESTLTVSALGTVGRTCPAAAIDQFEAYSTAEAVGDIVGLALSAS